MKNGAPMRLIVPGWYGVANVKWLDHIHAQDTRYMGRFMGRDYVTLKSEDIGGETLWMETMGQPHATEVGHRAPHPQRQQLLKPLASR